jgi:hypothetical protein
MPKLAIYGVVATVVLGVILGTINYIQRRERAILEGEQVKDNLNAIVGRIQDNEKVQKFDLPALCRGLDGVWVNGKCE